MKPKQFPLFFGSTVVLGCFLGMMCSNGAMMFTSMGVLVKPLTEEFGWSRGDVSFGATLVTVGIIIGLLTTGPLIDRFGARRVLLVCVSLSCVIVAAGPFLISSLAAFYCFLVLAAIAGGPTNTSGYARVVACWYDRRRGLFIGINACGMGLGFAVAPLVTDFAVRHWNWQAGYVSIALLMAIIAIPSLVFLVIDKPSDVGLQVDGDEHDHTTESPADPEQGSLSLKEAMATPTFWLLLYIVATLAFALQGTLIHLVPLLIDRGIEPSTAALVASTVGLSMVAARLVVGFALDYMFAPRLAMIVFSLAGMSIVLILFTNYLPLYFLAAILVGFGIGAEGDLMAYMVSRYFGMRSFALIFSVIFSFYILGTGTGPAVFGYLYDSQGNYEFIQYVSLGLMVSAIVLFVFLAPYDRYLKTAGKRSIAIESACR